MRSKTSGAISATNLRIPTADRLTDASRTPRHHLPEALADLESIWDHIAAQGGATVASDFVADLLDAVDGLAEMPGKGHERADVDDPRYRFWAVKSYVIAYRADEQTLRVARVVHGHRDFRGLFRGDS